LEEAAPLTSRPGRSTTKQASDAVADSRGTDPSDEEDLPVASVRSPRSLWCPTPRAFPPPMQPLNSSSGGSRKRLPVPRLRIGHSANTASNPDTASNANTASMTDTGSHFIIPGLVHGVSNATTLGSESSSGEVGTLAGHQNSVSSEPVRLLLVPAGAAPPLSPGAHMMLLNVELQPTAELDAVDAVARSGSHREPSPATSTFATGSWVLSPATPTVATGSRAATADPQSTSLPTSDGAGTRLQSHSSTRSSRRLSEHQGTNHDVVHV